MSKQNRSTLRPEDFKKHRRLKHPVLLSFIMLLLLAGSGVGLLYQRYHSQFTLAVEKGYVTAASVNKSDFLPRQPTKLLAQNGQVLKELTKTRAVYLQSSDINPLIKQSTIKIEDRRFYQHKGVDLYGTARALLTMLKNKLTSGNSLLSGGSTITQQLVKNVVLKDQSQSLFARKVPEMVIAQELEKRFSKKELLEFYLNNLDYGHGTKGIGSASLFYFGVDQKDLTIDQIALLVGIPNNPNLFDPISQPKFAISRRNVVLNSLYNSGVITKVQFKAAIKLPLKLNVTNPAFNNDISKNYAISFALNDAAQDMMRVKGFNFKYLFNSDADKKSYQQSYNQAYQLSRADLLNGGYTIKTSINPALQDSMQSLAANAMIGQQELDAAGKYKLQMSATIIDNRSGDVLASIGGRNTVTDQLNRSFLGYRQPGSTAKPITAYAPAFERGLGTDSMITDSKVPQVPTVTNWYPGFRGQMSLRTALSQSVNTVALKLALADPKQNYYYNLAKMQFDGLTTEDRNPIISIGGFTDGVTTTQMAGAYSSFTRQGNFVPPSNINSIVETNTGRILYQNEHSQTKVYGSGASYMTLNLMQSVINSGLGKPAALSNYKFTAGKTGTTDNSKDAYFVGVVPNFTIAIWVGYDNPKTLSYSQTQLPMAIFKAQATQLIKDTGQNNADFAKPKTVTATGVGLIATPDADKGENKLKKELDDLNTKRINSEILTNDQRLAKMDYRIIGHISTAEEIKREKKVLRGIDAFQNLKLASTSQYAKFLVRIKRLRYDNLQVKHGAAQKYFGKQINQLEIQLNKDNALLETKAEQQKLDKTASAVQSAKDEWAQRQANALADAKEKYSQQLAETTSVLKSNKTSSEKDDSISKLKEALDKVRSLGGSQADPTLVQVD